MLLRVRATTGVPRFGARAALITAGIWLTVSTLIAVDIAPAHWRTRITLLGLASILPALLAIRPAPFTALAAAGCWAVPGILLVALQGLGAVWLIAAASAFTGAAVESNRRRHSQLR
jgi:hypothetical protein